MAYVTGTNGNDLLISADGGEVFLPLLGFDTVVGGAGFDELRLDWHVFTANGGTGTILANGTGAFAGSLQAGAPMLASVEFRQIEALDLTLSAGADTVFLDASPLAAGARIVLDGGAGLDTLRADFSALGAIQFAMGSNFLISASHGSFAGFEQFDLVLGNGNNTVVLQGGADTIRSGGGTDQIDGGAGRDTWLADFSTWTSALAFGWDGDRNMAAVSNGTQAVRIEGGAIVGGSADDAFFLNGANPFAVDGGAGRDMLIWDESGRVTVPYAAVFTDGGRSPDGIGQFCGSIRGSAFTAIEQINVALSDADNAAFVDTAPLAAGATMNLDGGGGNDTLEVDFSAWADTTFALDANGTAVTSHGIYSNFEHFGMALGGGSNAVTTGAGDDTIYSLGGADTIEAGGGFDLWGGDWSDSAQAITFSWDGTTGAGSLSNGTTLLGFETGYLIGSGGDDSFALRGAMPFDIHGGPGRDTLIRDDAGLTGAGLTGAGTASAILDGAGSFTGWVGNGQFDGIEQLIATFGDEADTVFVQAAPLALGASLSLNGGMGEDTLVLDASALADTVLMVDGTGTANGNRGTHAGFERFMLVLGGGVNEVRIGIGADTVEAARGGNSTIATGDGDDMIRGGSGRQTVDGGAGEDVFILAGRTDRFTVLADGLGGYLVIDGEAPEGEDAADQLHAVEWVAFDDGRTHLPFYAPGLTLSGTAGADVLIGTAFADTLLGLAGNDNLDGGDGNDTLNAGAGNDTIRAGAGIDTLDHADAAAAIRINLGVVGKSQLTGGAGSDWLVDLIEHATGSAYADVLTGNALDNRLEGRAGNDTLDGSAGADTLIGGQGNDRYVVDSSADVVIESAGDGTDTVLAKVSWTLPEHLEHLTLAAGLSPLSGVGNDLVNTLTGNGGTNHLRGLGGNDRLDGGGGADTLEGGLGNDTYVVDTMADVVIEQPGEGVDTVLSKVSWVLGAHIEKLTLSGTAAIDGAGNALANTLTGNGTANTLAGHAGADTIVGGGGDDRIIGGAGADVLTGGAGRDVFVFDTFEAAAQRDTVKDFTPDADRLAIAREAFSAFVAVPAGAIDAADFTLGSRATTAAHHLVYEPTTGELFYDADGAGGAAQVEIARFSNKPVLDAEDFLLI